MATYVDGYVIPIMKANVKSYKKLASLGCKVWTEHGALDYFECVGDDLKAKCGLPFTKLCKLKPNETAIFAFIVYKSKADRNRINKAVMMDPRMNPPTKGKKKKMIDMPFDMKRFAMGGFKTLVQA
jgi:uncharacterized protein YbaA (DUF1428 family)